MKETIVKPGYELIEVELNSAIVNALLNRGVDINRVCQSAVRTALIRVCAGDRAKAYVSAMKGED